MVCKVLNGVIAQCAGDWEEVCGRNGVWSQIAWDAASGSVSHCGGHVIILPPSESSCQVQEAFSRSYLTSKPSLLRRKQTDLGRRPTGCL